MSDIFEFKSKIQCRIVKKYIKCLKQNGNTPYRCFGILSFFDRFK